MPTICGCRIQKVWGKVNGMEWNGPKKGRLCKRMIDACQDKDHAVRYRVLSCRVRTFVQNIPLGSDSSSGSLLQRRLRRYDMGFSVFSIFFGRMLRVVWKRKCESTEWV